MRYSTLAIGSLALLILSGCGGPTRPEVAALDSSLPFNQAMDAAITKDEFLKEHLRPGFYKAADGGTESYTPSPDEEGSLAVEHLAKLTRDWCARNGGRIESFPEVAVLQRGVGNVISQRDNQPVVGKAQNLVCYRGREALAEAAIGRTSFFLNAAQFRHAMREAGASITEMHLR